ncbi:MAG: hypothetical protein RR138_00190 [Akkermansia sp.]
MNTEEEIPTTMDTPHQEIENTPDLPTSYSLLEQDGAFSPDWYKKFDELQSAEKTLAKFKRPEALAKSYAELEKMHAYPSTEEPEKMALFRSLVGLPEKAEDYAIPCPEGIDTDCWDQNLAQEMSKIAYENGVPAQAMEALVQAYSKNYTQSLQGLEEQQRQAEQDTERALQEEWGRDTDRGKHQAAGTVRMLAQRAGVDPDTILDNPALGSNPDFIKIMRAAALMMDEAPLRRNDEASPTPSDELKRMESDENHPLHEAYMNVSHPNHKYANELYDRLAFGKK